MENCVEYMLYEQPLQLKWYAMINRNYNNQFLFIDFFSIFRNKSIELVKQKHPFGQVVQLKTQLEQCLKQQPKNLWKKLCCLFMQKLCPKSLWRFFGFPNCYNDKDAENCSQVTMKYNDQISWLFEWSSVLFPTVYLHDKAKLDSTLFVKYRLLESFRFTKKLNGSPTPVFL